MANVLHEYSAFSYLAIPKHSTPIVVVTDGARLTIELYVYSEQNGTVVYSHYSPNKPAAVLVPGTSIAITSMSMNLHEATLSSDVTGARGKMF